MKSPQNNFSSFLTLHLVPHTPKSSGICEEKNQRFSMKNLWVKNEKSMEKSSPILLNSQGLWNVKLPAQSHGHSCWKNCKLMHCSQIYLHFFNHFSSFALQISLHTEHFFYNFFQPELPQDWAGHFAYHNQNGWQLFHGFLIFSHRFFIEFFSSKMPDAWGMWNYVKGQKRRKLILLLLMLLLLLFIPGT